MVPFCPYLAPIGPHLVQFGPHFVQFGSYLVSTWSHVVCTWSYFGPTLVPFGPLLVSVSSHLIPIRSHLKGFSAVLGSRKASKTSAETTLYDFGTHLGLWPSWGRLGGVLQVSWAIFEASLDVLGASWRVLECLARCLRVVLDWAFLGILWRL